MRNSRCPWALAILLISTLVLPAAASAAGRGAVATAADNACVGDRSPMPGSDQNRSTIETGLRIDDSGLTCCPEGYYTCPRDGAEFAYGLACSSDPSKTWAQSACLAYCGRTCTDSGWFCVPPA